MPRRRPLQTHAPAGPGTTPAAPRRRPPALPRRLALAAVALAAGASVVGPAVVVVAADPGQDVVERMRRRRAEQAGGEPAEDRQALADRMRKSRADQLGTMREEAAGRPLLPTGRIEDVVQLTVAADGRVDVATPAADADPARGTEYRLALAGYDRGPAFLDVDPVGGARSTGPRPAAKVAAGGPRPDRPARRVTFTAYQTVGRDALAVLVLQWSPGSLQASRQVQRDDGIDLVQLLDQHDPDAPGAGATTLRVIRSGGSNVLPAPVSVSLQEPDLPALMREHPREAADYLRPLLRDLGQDHLFAPDWRAAWQVLADAWPAHPGVAAKVAAVLPRLDDPDFRRRDRALADLVALGRDGAAALRHLDRSTLSAEQNRLVGLALAPFDTLPAAEAARLTTDVPFLLDCLQVDDPTVRRAAAARLAKVAGRADLPFAPDAPTADRRAAVRQLREELLESGAGPATRPAPVNNPGSDSALTRPAGPG